MKCFCFLVTMVVCATGGMSAQGEKISTQASFGRAFDEIVVDTSLNIRHKASAARHPRDVLVNIDSVPRETYHKLERVKRQFNRRGFGGPGNVGSSSSSANAASQSQFARPGRFGASAASAQAQGFQSIGPQGGFGASAAGTQTQSFTAGPRGLQGSAGSSASQTYNLPNGKTLNVAFSNGFSTGSNGRPSITGGRGISIS